MRQDLSRRLPIAAVAAGLLLVSAACSSAGSDSSSPGGGTDPAFVERTATVDGVEVRARPIRIDTAGAAFTVTLDTHSGSLDADLATASTLEVGGTPWLVAGWDGDPPGGHHREGTLRFNAAGPGPVAGTATLTVGGLNEPVPMSWTVGGG